MDGAGGWYLSAIDAGVTGSDATSGFASATISDNGGAAQAVPVRLGEGIHSLVLVGRDVAGNSASALGYAQIDLTTPSLNPILSTANPDGRNGWYITPLDISVTGTDALSGFAGATISVGGGAAQSGLVHLVEGVHSLNFSGTDVAGNIASITRTISIDLTAPIVSPSLSIASPNGGSGWYITELEANVSGFDALSGIDLTRISLDGGTALPGPVHLSEGVHSLVFTGTDIAGNSTSVTQTVSVDMTSPGLTPSLSIPSPDGANGWYGTRPDAEAAGTDALSGVARLGVEIDGGAELAVPATIPEGIHVLAFRAVDAAGNITEHSMSVRIDTTIPSSHFTSHVDGEIVVGVVELQGSTTDALSGFAPVGEISLDNGATWQSTSLNAFGEWGHSWDTKTLPNGNYTLLMRATDNAGNQENTARLTLFVANEPPHVRLTPATWSIWSDGDLSVSPNGIPIKSVIVVIRDPNGIYPKREFSYSPNNIPDSISWDRRFGDGTLAPSGDYIVEAVACDIFNNCAKDRATITIPFLAPPPLFQPTFTPTPTAALTAAPDSERAVPVGTPMVYMPALTPEPVVVDKAVEIMAEEHEATWPVTTLSGLVLLFALTAVLDPRPRALRSISAILVRWMK